MDYNDKSTSSLFLKAINLSGNALTLFVTGLICITILVCCRTDNKRK